jgi:hypothetical protein
MKPYQISLKKTPNKWGKEGTKRKDPSPTKKQNKTQSGLVCIMGHRNKSCSKILTKHKKNK